MQLGQKDEGRYLAFAINADLLQISEAGCPIFDFRQKTKEEHVPFGQTIQLTFILPNSLHLIAKHSMLVPLAPGV